MNSKIILLAVLICMIAVLCTDAGKSKNRPRPKPKDGKGKDGKAKDENTSTDKKDKKDDDDDDDNDSEDDRRSRRRSWMKGNSRSYCRRQCRGVNYDQVCATDGKDYSNRCLMFCQSSDRRVKVDYRGRCDSNSSGDKYRSTEKGDDVQAAGLRTGIRRRIL